MFHVEHLHGANMKKLIIFDLDATVIDSTHRVAPCMLPNGDLDLNLYREQACTRPQVYKDDLLPLSLVMLEYIAQGVEVAIVTARHMFKHDYDFLKKHGLKTNMIFSRDKLHKHFGDKARQLYTCGDAQYKGAYFKLLKELKPDSYMILYDDHLGVLREARKHGIKAIDATHINRRIATFNAVGFS
jgi:FMN phosphatase YigB (HAD superfamily)